jgi:putative peptidoglycan lipid II flippase
MSKNKTLLEDSVITTLVSLGAQFITFLISAFIAAYYGATSNTDAFFYALSAVLVVNAAVSGVLKSVFTPVFLRFTKTQKQSDKEILASFYLYFTIFLFGLWSIFNTISFIATKYLQIPGMSDRELLFRMIFQLSFMIIFNGFVECFSTTYNSYQKFIIPILTPIIRSAFFIGFVLLTLRNLGVESLSLGNSIAELLHFLLLFILLKWRGFYFGLSLTAHPAVKKMMSISLPSLLSNATTRINEFVDASFIAPVLVGGVTIVNYANKISSIPLMLLSGGFLTVILTHWSLKRDLDNNTALKSSVLNSMLAVGAIFTPIIVTMFVLREPLVKVMYERSNFTSDLSSKTSILVGIYLLGLLPLMLGRILTRAFLTLEDTWTPFWVGNIRAVANTALNFVLISLFGYTGVAMSTALNSLLLFGFMLYKLKNRLQFKFDKEYLLEWMKIVLSGLIVGLLISNLLDVLSARRIYVLEHSVFWEFVSLGILSLIGLFIYISMCYLLKLRKLYELVRVIRGGLKEVQT